MKHINPKFKKFLPLTITLFGILLIGLITFISTIQNPPSSNSATALQESSEVLGVAMDSSPMASSSATPIASVIKKAPLTRSSPLVSTKPNSSPSQIPVSTSQPNNSTGNSLSTMPTIQSPTPTLLESASPSASLAPSPSSIEKVAVEIKQPDGDISFDSEINNGMNICQLMQKAKDEGKINSLTIDDKYLSTFNTLLITEINGYKNNWVFTLNGDSPMGCSLTSLKNSDKIIWEFLSL